MQWKCSRCRAADARQHHSELRRTAKTPIYSRACTLHTVTQFIPAQQLDVLLWEQHWEQRRGQRRHWGARGAENAVNPTFRIRKTAEQVKTHKLWYICSCSPSDVADLIQNVGNCSILAHSTSNHPNLKKVPIRPPQDPPIFSFLRYLQYFYEAMQKYWRYSPNICLHIINIFRVQRFGLKFGDF